MVSEMSIGLKKIEDGSSLNRRRKPPQILGHPSFFMSVGLGYHVYLQCLQQVPHRRFRKV